jgi:hypothetical protein
VDDEGNSYIREIPVAIGRRVCDENGVLPPPDKIVKKSKGVAVQIEHFFLDELWNYGNQKLIISEDWTKIMIKRANGSQPDLEDIKREEDPTKEDEANGAQDESPEKEENQEEVVDKKEQNLEEEEEKQLPVEPQANEESLSEDQSKSTLTPEEMDGLIKRNFLMCLIRHIKDSALPLEPSQLQGEYMYKFFHKDLGKIDFKKSNFNKITKFLKKMKQQKLINFEKPKGMDHEIITGINRKGRRKDYL